jgi:transcriptional regulator with XRE-family HTH domain
LQSTRATMGSETFASPNLEGLGRHLRLARAERGLNQSELAQRCGLAQQQVSYLEAGRRRPSLDQVIRIAGALDIPIQRLLAGADRPGTGLEDIAVELRGLGVADLWVRDARVPGAFRRPEEVIALAVSGQEPDPRIIEAIPAALAWAEIHPVLLRAYATETRTAFRLGWLADVALTIERQGGFPGGCGKEPLARFLKALRLPGERASWDGLGKPADEIPRSPLWRRWKIRYDAHLDAFKARAAHLEGLRGRPGGRIPRPSDARTNEGNAPPAGSPTDTSRESRR